MHVETLKDGSHLSLTLYMCIAAYRNHVHENKKVESKLYMSLQKAQSHQVAFPQVINSFESQEVHVLHST